MENTIITNNTVKIGGVISSEFIFSHEIYEEKFYKVFVEVERLSELKDNLPVIVSERLINIDELKIGTYVEIEGQFRSYNDLTEAKSKLILSVFAKKIELKEKEEVSKLNDIILEGFICKKPVYRKTPLGREISDVLIAVNRSYKKSDYIPCILWGRNAKFSEKLDVGTKVKIEGRVQARNYEKKLEDGNVLKNVAYEVSASKFGVVLDEPSNNTNN